MILRLCILTIGLWGASLIAPEPFDDALRRLAMAVTALLMFYFLGLLTIDDPPEDPPRSEEPIPPRQRRAA